MYVHLTGGKRFISVLIELFASVCGATGDSRSKIRDLAQQGQFYSKFQVKSLRREIKAVEYFLRISCIFGKKCQSFYYFSFFTVNVRKTHVTKVTKRIWCCHLANGFKSTAQRNN